MYKKGIILIVFLCLCCVRISFAQSNGSSKKDQKREFDRGATYDTKSSKKSRSKKSKNSLAGEYDKKIEEYEKRMKDNAKRHKKMAKEMKKPKYSDPTYFGHKKKPKKRPRGKKKFCKECGLYH